MSYSWPSERTDQCLPLPFVRKDDGFSLLDCSSSTDQGVGLGCPHEERANPEPELTHHVPKSNTQHKACKDNIPFSPFRNTQASFGGTEHLLPGATGCVRNLG